MHAREEGGGYGSRACTSTLGSVPTYVTLELDVAVGSGFGCAVAGASFTRGPIRFA